MKIKKNSALYLFLALLLASTFLLAPNSLGEEMAIYSLSDTTETKEEESKDSSKPKRSKRLKFSAGYVADYRKDIPGGILWMHGPYIKLKRDKDLFIYVYISGTNSRFTQGTYEYRYYRVIGKGWLLGAFHKVIFRQSLYSSLESRYSGQGLSLIYIWKPKLEPLSSVFIGYYYHFPMKQVGNAPSPDIERMHRFYLYLNFKLTENTSISIGRKWVSFRRAGNLSMIDFPSYKLNLVFKW